MAEYYQFVQTFLREILQSGRFSVSECRERKLSVSQAFCLLWQNPETGDVPGRLSDEILHNAGVVAVLLDLYVCGRVELCIQDKSFFMKCGLVSQGVDVKVTNTTPTDSYLDDALFRRLLEDSTMRSAGDWMIRTFPAIKGGVVLTPILDSLVNLGILSKEASGCIGKNYPTVNQAPQKALVKELQMIALQGQHADGFMWPLLKLARGVDSLHLESAPMLRHHFHKKDYAEAKKALEKLIKVDKKAKGKGTVSV